MTAAIAALGAVAVVIAVSGLPPLRRPRLGDRVEPYVTGLHGRPSALLHAVDPATTPRRWLEARAERLGAGGRAAVERRLRAAGLGISVGRFRVEQVAWSAACGAAAASVSVLALAAGARVAPGGAVVLVAVAASFGAAARDWRLGRQVQARRAALEDQLPAAIDLVTLAIVSGESVSAAFARVGALLPGALGDELDAVVADVRAGVPALDALQEMKKRVPGRAAARFVDALCTGIERGTPLADVLRAQADDARDARRRALLEAGGRREVAMLVPVVFLVMPVVVLFALYPSLVSLDLLVP
ncbi:MAG TPA: type II secretion system F family protein [Actinomycetota bacterium]|nr:type II secretion system F family protein [Actinomycetota bacterium]